MLAAVTFKWHNENRNKRYTTLVQVMIERTYSLLEALLLHKPPTPSAGLIISYSYNSYHPEHFMCLSDGIPYILQEHIEKLRYEFLQLNSNLTDPTEIKSTHSKQERNGCTVFQHSQTIIYIHNVHVLQSLQQKNDSYLVCAHGPTELGCVALPICRRISTLTTTRSKELKSMEPKINNETAILATDDLLTNRKFTLLPMPDEVAQCAVDCRVRRKLLLLWSILLLPQASFW